MKRLAVVTVTAALLAGCGGTSRSDEEKVLDALAATELLSRTMDYRVSAATGEVSVAVTVEDDYRYASELSLDGRVAYREVVYDDTLAAQLIDEDASELLGQAPDAPASLAPGGWLVDELGAPASVPAIRALGDDPIVDALAYFTYVREAARASTVQEFDEDALDYRPDEDPFPEPEDGEQRFDILPTRLPDRSAIERAGAADVPDLSDLRKLAVYVRDDEVVRVREAIDVQPFGDRLRRVLDLGDAADDEVLDAVNELRESIGQQPIAARTTVLEVADRGTRLVVDLPAGTAATLALHLGEIVTPPA